MVEVDIFAESVGPWGPYKAPRKRRPRRTDRLTQEAKDILIQGLRENAVYRVIRDRIAARTGEDVSVRIIERAGVVWRATQRRMAVLEEPSGVLGRLCWRVDELVELVGAVETGSGAYLRRRNRIFQAVRAFLKNPNCTTMRCLEREAVLFAFEQNLRARGEL